MNLLLIFSCLLVGVFSMSELGCFFCQQITTEVLLDPGFANETEKILDKICNFLPHKEKDICLKAAASIDNIVALLQHDLGKMDYSPFGLCTMMDQCAQKCCLTNTLPEQIHLSWSDDTHTTMTVKWTTLNNISTVVRYGLSPQKLINSLSGNSITYTKGGWVGFIHTVFIKRLQAGTRYYYQVGSGASSEWSSVYSFITEPSVRDRKITFASIADMGTNNSENTIAQLKNLVKNKQIDFVLHNGDISYADGDQVKWDIYFRSMQDVVANVPYMVNPGNHEVVISSFGVAIGYIHRFTLPGNHSISNSLSNMYYSFDYGLVHFISLDTESPLDVAVFTAEQKQWLINDLKSVNRQNTPWVIAFGHRPLYCSNSENGNDVDCKIEASVLRPEMEKIYNDYKVDIVLSGHKHNFERFWPTRPGGVPVKTYNNPGVPTYVLNGAAGNREGGQKTLKYPIPNSVYYGGFVGYGVVTVHNRTHLQHDFYESATGKIMDTFTLVKN